MSSPQPKRQQATSAAPSVRRAKQQPTIENVVTAMEAIHDDVEVLKADVATLKADVATLKADVATLKADVATLKADVESLLPLKTDVRKLLDHFGLVSGDAP